MKKLPFPFLWTLAIFTTSALPTQETVASGTMELRNDLAYVQVMVNGHGPFKFVIDTGTNADAAVTAHLVEQLSLPRSGDKLLEGDDLAAHRVKVPAFHLDSVSIAGVEFKDLRAHQCPEIWEYDGILGFTLFRDYLFTLDYPNQKITLARGNLPPADGKETLALIMMNKLPFIEFLVDSRKMEVMIDSGGRGLSLPARFAEDLKFVSRPIVFARQQTVSSIVELKGARLASDIHFGDYTLPTPFIALDPFSEKGNFGAALLRNFAVTFDQNNKLVRFVGKGKKITCSITKRSYSCQ